MRKNFNSLVKKSTLLLFFVLLTATNTFAQSWPTASELADKMIVGWNLGNSLEVPGGETAWGNPATTQTLINAVSAAGFNTIRIPCAWDSYANDATYIIEESWLNRVKEVVDYCANKNMYVIINIHWDGGWLEEHPFYSSQNEVNKKQKKYWEQIANHFVGYDEHLLFAGTNEVHADYNTPTAEHIEVQESFNQTFVDAVRSTGGNNTSRILIVQTYNTNMWHGLEYFTMPNDVVSDRLMVEMHFYDPYNYTLDPNNNTACTVWGQPWANGDVCSWGQESYVEDLFGQVKANFVDKGIPIVIGEYGVVKRTSLSGNDYTDHVESRAYYLEYITDAAKRYNLLPIYWDNGYNGDMGHALFNRSSGAVVDQKALDAVIDGAGGTWSGVTYTLTTSIGDGSGKISLTPSGGVYKEGAVVTIKAEAEPGWRFDNWEGDLSGSNNPVSITMNANHTIKANFIISDGEENCDNPEAISLPFEQSGSGEYCWVTSGDIGYVNSWGADVVEINGVNYTNNWYNNMPDKIDGQYYIYYKGAYDWSHVELSSLKSTKASELISKGIKVYPNPFKETINLLVKDPDSIKSIVIIDQLGRQVKTINEFSASNEIQLGQSLDSGVYTLQIRSDRGVEAVTITKKH